MEVPLLVVLVLGIGTNVFGYLMVDPCLFFRSRKFDESKVSEHLGLLGASQASAGVLYSTKVAVYKNRYIIGRKNASVANLTYLFVLLARENRVRYSKGDTESSSWRLNRTSAELSGVDYLFPSKNV